MPNTNGGDADRDALQRLVDHGIDLSRPISIDFQIRVPDRQSAELAQGKAATLGFDTDLDFDDEAGEGTLYCTRRMLATYENMVGTQAQLNEAMAPFGAECDGWGTFGD